MPSLLIDLKLLDFDLLQYVTSKYNLLYVNYYSTSYDATIIYHDINNNKIVFIIDDYHLFIQSTNEFLQLICSEFPHLSIGLS